MHPLLAQVNPALNHYYIVRVGKVIFCFQKQLLDFVKCAMPTLNVHYVQSCDLSEGIRFAEDHMSNSKSV